MTNHPPHQLLGRSEYEVTWFKRRSLVQAAGLWVAAGGWTAAHAQARSNIVELRGDALKNGEALTPQHTLTANDRIETGSGSTVVFTVGDSAFMVRQNSRIALESDSPTAVKLVRVLSGAVVSVWGRGPERSIALPTATAGIRGTGVYTEVFADQGNRGYLCNCYGTIDLLAGNEKLVSTATYHQSFWAEPALRDGRMLTPAAAINHTDEELEFLAGLVNQRTAWQIAGRKGDSKSKGLPGYSYGPPGSRD